MDSGREIVMKVLPDDKSFGEVKKIISDVLGEANQTLRKDDDLTVTVGWTENSFVKDRLNGVIGETQSSQKVRIRYNSRIDGWKRFLRPVTAHEYAHAWFFEKIGRDRNGYKWRLVMSEALSQNFAEKMYPETEPSWRTKVNEEKLREHWEGAKGQLDEEVDGTRDPLFFGNQKYPKWYGYALSYRIGSAILEENQLEDFPDLGKERIVKEGDLLFGEEK